MAKVYLPTYNDLKINNGTELQLKPSASGKTLAECELGEIVYIPETINNVKDFHEYIVVEKNQDNVVLLRKYVTSGDSGAISQDVNAYVHGNFYASGSSTHYADNWCTTTFINRFSTTTQNYITTKVIKIISNSNGTTTNFQRKAFLPSVDELGGTPNIGNGEGTSVWFTTNEERITYIETDKTNPIQYWTRTLFSFTISSHNYYHFSYINNTGGFSEETYSGTASKYYRPAVVFLPTTPLNGSNQFVDEIIYTDTIDTIKFGDDSYRLKDTEARVLINTKQDKLPNGTADDDILLWNNTNQEWVAKQPSRLPSAYQEVEYIESDGTGQYIDTGIMPNGTTTIILDFEFKNAFVSWGGVFGAYSQGKHFAVTWQANDGVVHYCHGSSESGDKTFTRNKRYILKIGEMLSATTDSCFNYTPSLFTADTSIWLFTYAHSTSTFAEKIYRFQHYENGLIQHDFVPCYRIADSVIGMYDTVNGVFHTNAGTGTFIKGADV